MEPKKYEFIEINNFIVAQGSAEHFEADFKLYRKLFPESRILKTLENPFPPQKKELDERMLFEILNADRICIETILENRGIVIPKFLTELTAQELLANVDLSALKYNEAKALVFKLKLPVENQRFETLGKALSDLIASFTKQTEDNTNDRGLGADASAGEAGDEETGEQDSTNPDDHGQGTNASDGNTDDTHEGDQGDAEKKS